MPDGDSENTSERRKKQIEGLPAVRRNVAGIDLGSERHWVCAPSRVAPPAKLRTSERRRRS